MSKPTGSEARPPKRPTPVLTEAQKDGLACVRCGLDFTANDMPSVPAGIWNSSQMFRCVACPVAEPDEMRQAAEIDELIERTAETAGRLFTQRFGAETGPPAERLMRDTLCRLVSGVEVDLVLLREAFAALRRGDLQTAERVWAVGR